MEDLQLISKLKELKQISPRKEWVVLVKTSMFEVAPAIPAQKASFMGFFAKKQLAYSFAVVLVMAVGVYGMVNFPVVPGLNIAKNSTASLAIETDLKNNVELFKVSSQNLSAVSKSPISDIAVAQKAVKDAAKSITQTLKKDPELASKVALEINNNKTYLDVAGGNASSEVLDMYRAVVVPLLKSLNEMTLAEDEKTEVKRIKTDFDNGGDSTTALRDILLISRAGEAK